jgi:hypothetical protein
MERWQLLTMTKTSSLQNSTDNMTCILANKHIRVHTYMRAHTHKTPGRIFWLFVFPIFLQLINAALKFLSSHLYLKKKKSRFLFFCRTGV